MKNQKLLWGFASIAVALIFGSCSKDDQPSTEPGNQLGVTGSGITLTTSLNAITRTTDTDLQTGGEGSNIYNDTKVGVFLTNGDSEDSSEENASYNATYANRQFSADGNGNLTMDDSGVALAFPISDASKANIYAYAPYNSQWSSLESEQTFSVKTDQSTDANYLASDLLYGIPSFNPVTAEGTGTQNVPLTFSHKLAKITLRFNVDSKDPTLDLKGATAKIQGTVASAKINLSTGVVSVADASISTITVATENSASDGRVTVFKCSAIIVPQTVKSDIQLIRLNTTGGRYTLTLEEDKAFEANKNYIYDITVGEASGLHITSTTTLTGWTDENIDGDMTPTTQAAIGDFVRQDGTIVKPTAIDEEFDNSTNPLVGIVFSDEVSDEDAAVGYSYYVMALRSTNSNSDKYYKYSSKDAQENPTANYTPSTEGSYIKASYYPEATLEMLTRYDGRSNTQAFMDYDGGKDKWGNLLQAIDPAKTDKFEKYAPELSENFTHTDWFVPSLGQWWLILQNLGGLKNEEIAVNSKKTGFDIKSETDPIAGIQSYLGDMLKNITSLTGGLPNSDSRDYDDYSSAAAQNPNIMTSTLSDLAHIDGNDGVWSFTLHIPTTDGTGSISISGTTSLQGSNRSWFIFAM